MIKETSAGTVLFRRRGSKVLFLLLRYPSGHWDFVKGKTERGESMRQTAVREAAEETGISDVAFVDGFEEWISYTFQYNGTTVSKKVVFFLGETRTKKVSISEEHSGYVWADYARAMRQITFDNAKSVLAKSMARLAQSLQEQPARS